MKLTLINKNRGPLTKIIRYQDGRILKDGSKCWLNQGKAKQVDTSLEKMAQWLRKLRPGQALIHGINGHKQIKIVSEKKYSGQADTIPRTKKHFSFVNGEGSAFFDHDPKPGHKAYSRKAFLEILSEVFPAIADMGSVWTPSTSSCIFKGGQQLVGQDGGMHIYFAVKNATDLPRFSEVLFKRLWIAGHGYIFITKDGKQLERTIFDQAVFSPERLDFVAGAVCRDGLEQRLPDPVYTPGNVLDTSLLPDLTEEEETQYQRLIEQAKEKARPAQETIRQEYVEQEAGKLVEASDGKLDIDKARAIIKARQNHVLEDDDILYFAQLKGHGVSVSEVLNARDQYHCNHWPILWNRNMTAVVGPRPGFIGMKVLTQLSIALLMAQQNIRSADLRRRLLTMMKSCRICSNVLQQIAGYHLSRKRWQCWHN